ncbi:hypothetical protein D9615_002324 [Tricholomella constricta]|uniref:BTB domain-containing protein n=1 Tax=Tricholomella constricta TaxID=117010 RepID=A0A8H5M986_9AGAR|nr:hypothetical protein D9615_002324 [Tricholomella constricta]
MADTTEEQEFKQLQRHPCYYLNGGDVHFLVGNQLFRVHRYFFERESRVFREQIELPTPPGRPRQGDDESVAIVLDVPPVSFEKFLGVFYNPRYSVYDWDSDDWISILELADKWEFDEVKNLAVRELEKQEISLIPRIALYQQFKIDHMLLVPLYAKLCSRPEALDEDESNIIGMKTTVLIFRARERLRAQPSSDGGRSPLPPGLEKEDVEHTITTLLAIRTPIASPTEGRTGEAPKTSGKGKGDNGGQNPVPNRAVNKNANGRTGRPVGPVKN